MKPDPGAIIVQHFEHTDSTVELEVVPDSEFELGVEGGPIRDVKDNEFVAEPVDGSGIATKHETQYVEKQDDGLHLFSP